MGHCKVGEIPHAAIATLICVGCIALNDYGNDNFLLFSAIYVDQLCFSFWMDAGLVWTLPNLQLHTVREW